MATPRGTRALLAAADDDALSDVLRALRVTGAVFFRWDVTWPFATAVPCASAFAHVLSPESRDVVSFHAVREGRCYGGLLGEQPLLLEAGDVLLVPRGDAYVIGSSAEVCRGARVDLEPSLAFFRRMARGELPHVVREGGGESAKTQLICGFLVWDRAPFNPLSVSLPALLRVGPSVEPGTDRLSALVGFALSEMDQPKPGTRCALLQLSELMFAESVRRHLQGAEHSTGWMAALNHAWTGRALAMLHRTPEAPWTLATLAREVGLSRSQLAEWFVRLVGHPPMQYLARWRMQLAAQRLRASSDKVSVIARDVGYASEAAFSRAFKRLVGIAPAEWRRRSSP